MLPRLHVVTDDDVVAHPDFVARAGAVLRVGGSRLALHLRAPGAAGGILYALAARLREPARAAGAKLLANDRADVALAADLDGVHLRERSLPPEVARRMLPPGRLVGLSVHDPGAAAAGAEADYLVAGTVFASSSHPGWAPAGLGLVAAVVGASPRPVLAIGGITPDRVREVTGAGAYGVAVVSGVWDAPDPGAAAAGYLEALA